MFEDQAVAAGEDVSKNILQSLKKEVDRYLVKLEMGLELNGAGTVEGLEGISKDLVVKALAVSFVDEDNLVMGRKDIGLHKLKENGPILFKRGEVVKDDVEAHVKAFELGVSMVVLYSHPTQSIHTVQRRMKMEVLSSLTGICRSMEMVVAKSVSVTDSEGWLRFRRCPPLDFGGGRTIPILWGWFGNPLLAFGWGRRVALVFFLFFLVF